MIPIIDEKEFRKLRKGRGDQDPGGAGVFITEGLFIPEGENESASSEEDGDEEERTRHDMQNWALSGRMGESVDMRKKRRFLREESRVGSREYYQKLPFRPGPEMMQYLRPLKLKRERGRESVRFEGGVPEDAFDGAVHCLIPETLVFSRKCNLRLFLDGKSMSIQAEHLKSNWEHKIVEEWSKKGEQLAFESEVVTAVVKASDWRNPESQVCSLVNRQTLATRLRQRPPECIFQSFVKCKGSKASVHRATWRQGKPVKVFNMISNSTYTEATEPLKAMGESDILVGRKTLDKNLSRKSAIMSEMMLGLREENVLASWFLPSISEPENVATFKVSSHAIAEIEKVLKRVIRHLEASLVRKWGLQKIKFDQIQCDFVRNEEDKLVLLSIRGFRLSKEAYEEASELEHAILLKREQHGDYYDSDEEREIVGDRKRAIRDAKRNQRYISQQRRGAHVSTKSCRLCSRLLNPDEHFEVTETMARSLRNQLFLRSCDVGAFGSGFLARQTSDSFIKKTGQCFHVCSKCYELWQTNERCLKAAKRLAASLVSSSSIQILLPGSPECERMNLNSSSSRYQIRAKEMPARDREAALQHRIVFIFHSFVDAPGNLESLSYKFDPNEKPVDISLGERKMKDIKQIKMHHVLGRKPVIRSFLMHKRVPVSARFDNRKSRFFGTIHFTRFLTSFIDHMLVDMNLVLHEESGLFNERAVLRCQVGLIRDDVVKLDPEIPLTWNEEMYFLPRNYFGMNPLPQIWIDGLMHDNRTVLPEKLQRRGVEEKEQKSSHDEKEEEDSDKEVFEETEEWKAIGDFFDEFRRLRSVTANITRKNLLAFCLRRSSEMSSTFKLSNLVVLLEDDAGDGDDEFLSRKEFLSFLRMRLEGFIRRGLKDHRIPQLLQRLSLWDSFLEK